MKKFGDTIRSLRIAQELGLRETAMVVGISPTYLSRIERGKESPPRPDIIKNLAKVLAADPDVLFRISASSDPDDLAYLKSQPVTLKVLRYLRDEQFTADEIESLLERARRMRKNKAE